MALLATATVAFKTINTQIRNRSFLPLQRHLSLSSSLSSFSFFRTVSARAMELERKNSTVIDENGVLKKGIAEFYDESSAIWEDIWGDHMHHGFYPPDSTVSLSDHRAAQIQMIEQALRFASIPLEDERKWPKKIVDVGCGIGGSSRYLTQKFGATAVGITLSPVQVQRANALAAAQGLANKCIAMALQDLVWFKILNLELFRRPFCEMGTGQVTGGGGGGGGVCSNNGGSGGYCDMNYYSRIFSLGFIFFFGCFIFFGSIATLYGWLAFSPAVHAGLSTVGCQEDKGFLVN